VANPATEHMLRRVGMDSADRESPLYRESIRPIEYGAMMDVAHENLDLGVSAICVAPFSREFRDPAWVTQERQRALGAGYALSLAWAVVEMASLRQRIVLRGEPRDAWKVAHWDDYLRSVDLFVPPIDGLTVLDNTGPAPNSPALWIDAFSF
jgi:predicted kinase